MPRQAMQMGTPVRKCVKATIDRPRRSILADEPAPDHVYEKPVRRARMDPSYADTRSTGRRPRRLTFTPAAAVFIVLLTAAVLVWAMVGDSGAHLVETEATGSTTTLPSNNDELGAAVSSRNRDALVVAIDDLGGQSADGSEQALVPESTLAPVSSTTVMSAASSQTAKSSATAESVPDRQTTTATATVFPAAPRATSEARSTATTDASTTTTKGSQPTSSSSSKPSSTGVVWEEHFNSLDSSRWQREHSTYGDGNGERQCYQPENVAVANGRLVLTARSETRTCPNGSTRTVTSGMVRSRGLMFSPGQAIEFRVKLTPPDPGNQSGLWPAVWASGWAGKWPRGGELDFLEVMTAEDPRRAMFSLHYADRSGDHELQNKAVPMSNYFSDRWHTIRFDYGRDGNLIWYLNGSRAFSVSEADTAQGYPAPFDEPITEIKINLAVGGRPGPLSSGALGSSGATFEVDYVKVFNL